MTIIFDFNRTLYEPDEGKLLPGALAALDSYAKAGYTLHLVSYVEKGREELLKDLGIEQYFATANFVDDKTDALEKLIRESERPVYVVGDHLQSEIRIGNCFGVRTVWLRRGAFANLKPEVKDDVPWRTVERLEDLRSVIPC